MCTTVPCCTLLYPACTTRYYPDPVLPWVTLPGLPCLYTLGYPARATLPYYTPWTTRARATLPYCTTWATRARAVLPCPGYTLLPCLATLPWVHPPTLPWLPGPDSSGKTPLGFPGPIPQERHLWASRTRVILPDSGLSGLADPSKLAPAGTDESGDSGTLRDSGKSGDSGGSWYTRAVLPGPGILPWYTSRVHPPVYSTSAASVTKKVLGQIWRTEGMPA